MPLRLLSFAAVVTVAAALFNPSNYANVASGLDDVEGKELWQTIHPSHLVSNTLYRPLVGDPVRSVAWSPLGESVATGRACSPPWVPSARARRRTQLEEDAASDPGNLNPKLGDFNPPGDCTGAGEIYDARTGVRKTTFDRPGVTLIHSVCYLPDGTLVSGDNDGQVSLYNETSGRRATISGLGFNVAAVACSPDGRMIAAAFDDGITKVYDPTDGHLVWESSSTDNEQNRAVAFSRDGSVLATGGQTDGPTRHGFVRVVATSTWSSLYSLPLVIGMERLDEILSTDGNSVTTLTFGEGGIMVVGDTGPIDGFYAGEGGTITLFDVKSTITPMFDTGTILRPRPLRTISPREQNVFDNQEIRALAISMDGKTLAASGGENRALLFDVTTFEPLGPGLLRPAMEWLKTSQASSLLVNALAFSPNGELALGTNLGHVAVFDVQNDLERIVTPGVCTKADLTEMKAKVETLTADVAVLKQRLEVPPSSILFHGSIGNGGTFAVVGANGVQQRLPSYVDASLVRIRVEVSGGNCGNAVISFAPNAKTLNYLQTGAVGGWEALSDVVVESGPGTVLITPTRFYTENPNPARPKGWILTRPGPGTGILENTFAASRGGGWVRCNSANPAGAGARATMSWYYP